MKSIALLCLFAASLSAQEGRERPAAVPMTVTVQSVDSTKPVTMKVRAGGLMFVSIGFTKGDTGYVSMEGNDGTATGRVTAEMTTAPGEMTFSASLFGPPLEMSVWPTSGAATPRLWARGHKVKVIRDTDGGLRVEARPF